MTSTFIYEVSELLTIGISLTEMYTT